MRPDITVVDGSKVTIIEVAIPYECSKDYIERRRREKIEKYQELIDEEPQQVECTEREIPIEIGCLGTMTETTIKDLKKLNLQHHKDALQMTLSTGSVNILNNHFRRSDFDR